MAINGLVLIHDASDAEKKRVKGNIRLDLIGLVLGKMMVIII